MSDNANRPDVAPCLSCRWGQEGACTLRGKPKNAVLGRRSGSRGRPIAARDSAGEVVTNTCMSLPEDLGASCPERLWSPIGEPWYDHPAREGTSSIQLCEDGSGRPPEVVHGAGSLWRSFADATKKILGGKTRKEMYEGRHK